MSPLRLVFAGGRMLALTGRVLSICTLYRVDSADLSSLAALYYLWTGFSYYDNVI